MNHYRSNLVKDNIEFEVYTESDDPELKLGWTKDGEHLECVEIHCGGDNVWLFPVPEGMSRQEAFEIAMKQFKEAPSYDIPGWYQTLNDDCIDNLNW